MSDNGPTSPCSYLDHVVQQSSHTKQVLLGHGVIAQTPGVFEEHFAGTAPQVIADETTYGAVARNILDQWPESAPRPRPIILPANVAADQLWVREIITRTAETNATPVAVGSGAICDLVKLAAHELGRASMCIATAPSTDAYASPGSSIIVRGGKLPFLASAPKVIIADLDILTAAPASTAAAGYADLTAKITAGADWLLAAALGIEPIDDEAWTTTQEPLRQLLSHPEAVARRDPAAIERLTCGLLLSGFAMQKVGSSRPASGAEHSFAHLWTLQQREHHEQPVGHGALVAVGTLASTAFYELLLRQPLDRLNAAKVAARWPDLDTLEREIRSIFNDDDVASQALEETREKYVEPAEVHRQLTSLATNWSAIRTRLKQQIVPLEQLRQQLGTAGAPQDPEEIGMSRSELRTSFRQALFIRKRFTIIDLVHRAGLWDSFIEHIFRVGLPWREEYPL